MPRPSDRSASRVWTVFNAGGDLSCLFTLSSDTQVRIRIVKQPNPHEIEPFDPPRFEVGRVYEIGPRLAELLTVCGYAAPEMRAYQQPDHPARRKDDKR